MASPELLVYLAMLIPTKGPIALWSFMSKRAPTVRLASSNPW
jgi:hypothetical protein